MSYRPITDADAAAYRWRVCIEHSCQHCGCGFSSVKENPRFCSNDCRIEYMKDHFSVRAKKLWADPEFRRSIQEARKAAGYPDPNREEAVARRKMRAAAKNSLHRSLRRSASVKTEKTSILLGYSSNDLIRHIESKFTSGMSWKNYGEWEVDHVRPISDFPVDAPLSEVNALSNLQPLWKADNRRKHARVGV